MTFEQANLQLLGQVRQFVDAEDAPVGARHQAVVNHHLVREIASLGDLDGVHFADQFRRRDVRRGQLLAVAVVAGQPGDRRVVARLGEQLDGVFGNRVQRVVVDLTAFHVRHPRVEQGREAADEAGLGLAAFAQEDHVLAGEEGILHLGDDGIFKAMNAGKQRLAVQHFLDQVLAHLRLHTQRLVACFFELAQRVYLVHERSPSCAGQCRRGWTFGCRDGLLLREAACSGFNHALESSRAAHNT